MDEAISIYITAADEAEAHRIAEALIGSRLAACVNILGPVASCFYWDGGVQEEREVALIAKALRADFDALRERVCEIHSYECPCIVAWPIADAHPPFLRWLAEETRGKRGGEG